KPAVTVARCALVAKPARALAARALETEAHRPGHLRHVSAAIALRAGGVCAGTRPRSIAGRAAFLAIDIQPNLRSLDRLPKIDIQRILEVRALLRSVRRRLLRPEPLIENVLKIGGAAALLRARLASPPRKQVREIESAEAHVRAAPPPIGHARFRIE